MTTEEAQDVEEASDCQHHWMIASPNGPTSMGECKLCGAQAEFRNSIPGSGWDRESAQSRRARQARGNTSE